MVGSGHLLPTLLFHAIGYATGKQSKCNPQATGSLPTRLARCRSRPATLACSKLRHKPTPVNLHHRLGALSTRGQRVEGAGALGGDGFCAGGSHSVWWPVIHQPVGKRRCCVGWHRSAARGVWRLAAPGPSPVARGGTYRATERLTHAAIGAERSCGKTPKVTHSAVLRLLMMETT